MSADEKLFDNWFDPVETGLRAKVRGFHRDDDRRRTRYGAVAAALRAPIGADGGG